MTGNGWNWTVAPGAEALAAALVGREPDWFPPEPAGAEKDNTARALFRMGGLFCKFYKKRPDQAESEWRALRFLQAAGVPVARPIAWSPAPGGGAVLATADIPGAATLKEAYGRGLLPVVAQLLRRMHAAGFLHLDLHVGNILVAAGRAIVIDVHRGRIGAVGPKDEERALGQFLYSLSRIAPAADTLRFLRLYRGAPDRRLAERVAMHADAFRRRHLASRTGSTF